MLDFLSRWNGRVTTWLARVAAFVLAALAIVTFSDVVARYFFNAPFPFTVEMTELAMGLIVYFAIGLTTHEEGHITVDIVTLRLTEWMRALVGMITNAIALAFLVFMVWQLWLRADFLYRIGDYTPIWHLSLWPFAFLMAAGSIFLLTGVLLHLLRALARVAGTERPQ